MLTELATVLMFLFLCDRLQCPHIGDASSFLWHAFSRKPILFLQRIWLAWEMLAPVTNRPLKYVTNIVVFFFSHVTIQRECSGKACRFPIYMIHEPVVPTPSENYYRHREIIKEIPPGKKDTLQCLSRSILLLITYSDFFGSHNFPFPEHEF